MKMVVPLYGLMMSIVFNNESQCCLVILYLCPIINMWLFFYLIFSIALMLKEHYPRLNTNCLNETTLWCIFGLRCEVLSAFLRRNLFCPRVQAHSCIHVCTPLTKRNSISSMCSLLLLYALCCCCNVIL